MFHECAFKFLCRCSILNLMLNDLLLHLVLTFPFWIQKEINIIPMPSAWNFSRTILIFYIYYIYCKLYLFANITSDSGAIISPNIWSSKGSSSIHSSIHHIILEHTENKQGDSACCFLTWWRLCQRWRRLCSRHLTVILYTVWTHSTAQQWFSTNGGLRSVAILVTQPGLD